MTATVKRLPDAEGLWLRRIEKRESELFLVQQVDFDGGVLKLVVYLDVVESFVTTEQMTTPLTRWFGPLDVPEGWAS